MTQFDAGDLRLGASPFRAEDLGSLRSPFVFLKRPPMAPGFASRGSTAPSNFHCARRGSTTAHSASPRRG
jgi:hypothetical protein